LNIDPYPHHVATAVEFVSDYLQKARGRSHISAGALGTIRKTLMDAFDHLPQCSASLRAARAVVVEKLAVVAGRQGNENVDSENAMEASSAGSGISNPSEIG